MADDEAVLEADFEDFFADAWDTFLEFAWEVFLDCGLALTTFTLDFLRCELATDIPLELGEIRFPAHIFSLFGLATTSR